MVGECTKLVYLPPPTYFHCASHAVVVALGVQFGLRLACSFDCATRAVLIAVGGDGVVSPFCVVNACRACGRVVFVVLEDGCCGEA